MGVEQFIIKKRTPLSSVYAFLVIYRERIERHLKRRRKAALFKSTGGPCDIS